MRDSTVHPTNPRSSGNNRDWRLVDVIDFEYLLNRDEGKPINELDHRDRRIAVEISQEIRTAPANRRALFRSWLDHRRAQFPVGSLPGPIAMTTWQVFLKLLAVIAFLLGCVTAVNLLRYDGVEPVNVATFLGWLVLVQIALVLSAVTVLLLRQTGFLSNEAALFTGLIRRGWSALAIRLNRHLLNRIPAEQRVAVESFLGSSNAMRQVHGGVAVWPLVGALQWFGICFNIAAIATTVTLILFSDRAFGWQSAANVSPDLVHQLTQILAAPWSWAIPSAAAPTLEQIVGSKIYLKDGIRQLTTGNLVAWWPFLVASVTVYGFLPRLGLWLIALGLSRRALTRLTFHHVACDRLYERLVSEPVQTQAMEAETPRTELRTDGSGETANTTPVSAGAPASNKAVILASDEIRSRLDTSAVEERLKIRFHLQPETWLGWSDAAAIRRSSLEQLRGMKWPDHPPTVVLIDEAWQPPIAEKLDGLRNLRQTLGARARLIVVLVGRPLGEDLITPVKPADLDIWQSRLKTLGDSQLRLEALIPND